MLETPPGHGRSVEEIDMTERTCIVDECDRTAFARSWCAMHYSRWQRRGDIGAGRVPRPRKLCSVDECERTHYGRGYCSLHHQRWWKHGDPLIDGTRVRGVCGFDGCERPHAAKGLCQAHWQQECEGRSLAPVQRRDAGLDRDDQGRKLCRGCDSWLELDRFNKNQSNLDGLMGRCRSCVHLSYVKRTYGITRAQYKAMRDAQGGGCAICGQANPDGRVLVVDHDHGCCPTQKTCGNCVRGLLCTACNMYLGGLGEDIDRLAAMIAYLKSAQTGPSAGSAGAG